jgi:glycosyltransferase involved in cell wall biosynthesis
MKKLVFCCLPGFETFIKPIAERLSSKFNVDLVMGNSIQEYHAKLQGADIIWIEWANQLAAAITQNLLPLESANKVILRLHSYECLTPGMLEQINYGAITDLLFVSEYIRDYTTGLSPQTFEHLKTHVIPNGLDLKRFPIQEGVTGSYDPDNITAALLGHLNTKKGPMLLAQAMYELHDRLPVGKSISFKIGGQWQDPRHEAYMMHFLEKTGMLMDVEFVQVPYGTANEFYQGVDVVLCTSPWESQNMSVMEGMASGCKPAIHHFPGAEFHYKPENLWLTFQELQEIVYSNSFEPAAYRKQVTEFDWQAVMMRIKSEILE